MRKIVLIFLFVVSVKAQWIYQQVPTNATHYLTIEFPGTQYGVVGGATFTQGFSGRGAYTSNAGSNWNISQVPDSSRVLLDIKFINSTTGYCAGAYNVFPFNHSFELKKYDRFTFQFIKSYSSDTGDEYKGLFLKTTNTGQSWFTYGILPSNVYYLLGLHFVNSTTGFAIASYNYSGGINSGVIKTINAGLNWIVLTLPENINDLDHIYFSDINTGYTVGSDVVNDTSRGVILKTTNSGINWNRLIFMDVNEFTCVHFTNSTTGLAISIKDLLLQTTNTRVYKTTNAGINWIFVSSFNDVGIDGIRFVNGMSTALIYGYKVFETDGKDFLARTTNYGSTWIEESLNDTGLYLFDSELLNQNNWYLTGGDFSVPYMPVILHTTNGGVFGITPISTEVSTDFSLSQNYPNPFNPTTKIQFSVPSSQFVVIKVFDVTGREVTVLVNEELKPRTYEVDWDAGNFPSGIYYYKLETENYSETKKMVLLK